MNDDTYTLNDPRRIALTMRIDLVGLTLELRNWYRILRRTGFDRRDSNLLVAGAAAVAVPASWSASPASLDGDA